MAASAKHFSLLFFLALFSSLHAHARDGQFFDKVTTPATANPKETVEVPNKEPPLSKQEQDPNFIPDTQNGYGLYGQESDQLTPTTPANLPSTASNLPYKTESEKAYYYYDKQAYVTKPQGMKATPPPPPTNNNNNNDYYMNKGYTAAAATDNYYNGVNNYNPQHQGMSDTRFLENGRYFYDIQSENNYNNRYGSSQGVDNYNKGYHGNSYNDNSYVENNSMEGYQNQEQFQEDQEEFVP
ncbi:hypothetical protein Acr_15g0016340 [Actinidia rufa]|uniref:Protein E6-like n=1 Tax=Actinidia rufa TaxID=165716 RepID=A0A7J0FWH5_9ERIC|nr:hypothetical protein Acr_15g0016340 [Actinidia rufa]